MKDQGQVLYIPIPWVKNYNSEQLKAIRDTTE